MNLKASNPLAVALADQPEYAAARKDLEAMALALGKVSGRIAELEAIEVTQREKESETSQVAAALRFALSGRVEGPDNFPTAFSDELRVLRQQHAALSRTMALRHQALSAIAGELSHKVCAALKPEHQKLAGRYLAVLKELDAMHEQEDSFMAAIEAKGYSTRFQTRITWFYVGRLNQISESAIWHHAREIDAYAL